MTSHEAAEAFVRAFTTHQYEDGETTAGIFVGSWAELAPLSDWLKHRAADRLPDDVYAMVVLADQIEPSDQEWIVSELLKHCEREIRKDLSNRLGWTMSLDPRS